MAQVVEVRETIISFFFSFFKLKSQFMLLKGKSVYACNNVTI